VPLVADLGPEVSELAQADHGVLDGVLFMPVSYRFLYRLTLPDSSAFVSNR
jgi:hypothetical protein